MMSPANPKSARKPRTPSAKTPTVKSAAKTTTAKKRTPAKLAVSAALSESLEKAEELLPPDSELVVEPEAAVSGGESVKKRSLGALYFSMLAKYPYMANATQAALINAAGVITSAAVPVLKGGEMKPIDWAQVLVFMLIGAFVVIPLILYVLVDKLYTLIPNMNKLQLLLISTLFGTFVISGAFAIAYPVLSDLLNPDPAAAACLKPLLATLFTYDFLANCLASRIVFFPADIANTFFVPPAFHPLVSNIAGFIWTVVLAIQMGN